MSLISPATPFPAKGVELQQKVTDAIVEAVKNGEDLLVVAPTGFGKTKVMADAFQRLLAEDPAFAAVMLQNRQSLALQNELRARQYGISADTTLVVMDGEIADDAKERRLVYALPDTLVGRTQAVGPRTLVAIDEAHHATEDDSGEMHAVVSDFCRMNKRAVVIGTTATPYPPEGTELYARLHNAKRVVVTYHEAIEAKMITGLETERPDYRLNDGSYLRDHIRGHLDDRRIEDTRAGLNSSIKSLRPQDFDESVVVRDILRNGEARKQTLHFTDTIQEAEARRAALVAAGIQAATLHSGNSSDQNRRIVEAYNRGEVHHLASVDMIGEGFDAPATELLILSKISTSRSEFQQICGRAQRLFGDKVAGKLRDYGASTDLYGSLEEFVKAQQFVLRGGRSDAWSRLQKDPMVQGLCVGKDVFYAVATQTPKGDVAFSVMRSYIDHKTQTRRIEPVEEPTTNGRFMTRQQLDRFARDQIGRNETDYIRLRLRRDVVVNGEVRSMEMRNIILGGAWKQQRESAVRMARGKPLNDVDYAAAVRRSQTERSNLARSEMLQKIGKRAGVGREI
ncbi:MAG: hypothetical protein DI537_05420 [Stutzerimonas stutzeri]|nr:MAG: hypothetical protein DI537_05420 [Stutzerimonas stutzeri]